MTDARLEQLADRLAELVADRLADRLLEVSAFGQVEPTERLIDAAEVARRLGVNRATVYEIADELGAVKLGNGARPRLRFDPAKVESYLAAREPGSMPANNRRRHRRRPAAELLPIQGERP